MSFRLLGGCFKNFQKNIACLLFCKITVISLWKQIEQNNMQTLSTKNQTVKIEDVFSIFNEKQIQAIKLIIKEGFWGGCDQEFGDKKNYSAHGYFTNLKKGKEFSGLMSGVSKILKSSGTNLISMCSDWWGDGSGDMIFFNMELIDEKELLDWAKI